jgi:hypothetical protein
MSNDVIYSEPVYSAPASAPAWDAAWNDALEKWMAGHLAITREAVFDTITEVVGDLLGERDSEIRALERKIAECAGAINVLRTGRTMRVRGTFNRDTKYAQLDVVAYGGSSFIATADDPGEIPGPGWQLLASAGGRGRRGERGEKGEPGAATAVPGVKALHLDRANYAISLFLTDGKIHKIDLRPLFQQFIADVQGGL